MPTFNIAADREFTPSTYADERGWMRARLYGDGDIGSPGYTTIVRKRETGTSMLGAFPFAWECFLLAGDLTLSGTRMVPGDHALVQAGESVQVATEGGCEYLVLARAAAAK